MILKHNTWFQYRHVTNRQNTEDSDTIRSDTQSFWVCIITPPPREWVTSPPPSPHPLGLGWPPVFASFVYYLHGERGAALSVGPHMDRNLGVVGWSRKTRGGVYLPSTWTWPWSGGWRHASDTADWWSGQTPHVRVLHRDPTRAESEWAGPSRWGRSGEPLYDSSLAAKKQSRWTHLVTIYIIISTSSKFKFKFLCKKGRTGCVRYQ